MEIVNSQMEKYLGDLYGDCHEVVREMEGEAARRNFPIVGPLVGRFLYQLARMVNARRVFEMGSGYGYSAFWWALAMSGRGLSADEEGTASHDGEIFLTEGDVSNKEEGERYLRRAGLSQYIKYHVGDALEFIDGTPGEFDIVFIDIEKRKYPAALEKACPRLRRGGLLVADNVLWSGKVLEGKGDSSTEGIKDFNRRLFSRKDFVSSIVPLRDGVAVAYKL